jgi:CRP-like cAMP-binding protein
MYQNIQLFSGIAPQDMHGLLDCISAYTKKYKRGEFLLIAGDKVQSIGIVLEGAVNIVKENLYGDRRIMMTAEANDIFAESIAAADINFSPVSVIAKQDCTILFVPMEQLLFTCGNSCAFHNKLIHNLVAI